jgi:hypothetical protein
VLFFGFDTSTINRALLLSNVGAGNTMPSSYGLGGQAIEKFI